MARLGILPSVLAVSLALSSSVTATAAIATPVYISSWNVCPSGGRPFGVAVDEAGYVYVTNQQAGTIENL